HLLGALVELRHKLPDVDAVLAERRANRRRGRRLPAGDLQPNLRRHLLRHGCPFNDTACCFARRAKQQAVLIRLIPLASIPAPAARGGRRSSPRHAPAPWPPISP